MPPLAEKQEEQIIDRELLKKEKLRGYKDAWRKANPEKIRAINAAYQKAHKEKCRALNAAWYKANREKARIKDAAYRKRHPAKLAAKNANRRARILGVGGRHTAEEIKLLLGRQKWRCAVCRKSIKGGYHKDHIIPLAHGGSNYIRNIQLLCPKCNVKKSTKHPIKFMQEMGYLL